MLAADGYDADWSPPKPFTRRMWAGGVIEWQPHNPLRVGQPATMTSRLLDAVAKRTGRGDAVFVSIEKRIENTAGEAMREQRSYVYLEHALPASGRASEPSARSSKRSASSDFHVTVHPTTMTLFRYSALTFNSHLIHYDQGYATDVEGYPGCLVHGPLTCTMLLDLFRRNAPGKTLTRFAYRAVSPVVVGQDMTLHGKWAVDGENKPYCELWATRADGAVAMKGTAEYTDAA
nr:hypothetical protein HK105_007604 [Polyrhizophydium stewartii]